MILPRPGTVRDHMDLSPAAGRGVPRAVPWSVPRLGRVSRLPVFAGTTVIRVLRIEEGEERSMRRAFVNTLVELAERDPRVLLLTGDLGYMALEPFAQRFPDRFFNVGVAEQNMVCLATGLPEAGFIPFVYSIVPFASLRPYQLIRNA